MSGLRMTSDIYLGFLIILTTAVAMVFLLNMGLGGPAAFLAFFSPDNFISPFLETTAGGGGLSPFFSGCFLPSCFLSSCPWAPFLLLSIPGTGCSGLLGESGAVILMCFPL